MIFFIYFNNELLKFLQLKFSLRFDFLDYLSPILMKTTNSFISCCMSAFKNHWYCSITRVMIPSRVCFLYQLILFCFVCLVHNLISVQISLKVIFRYECSSTHFKTTSRYYTYNFSCCGTHFKTDDWASLSAFNIFFCSAKCFY